MKNKVIVTIAGREYALTAAEDDGYVQRVAAFVDEQIHQVSQETHAAAIDAAVMAAMNIADTYFKEQAATENLRAKLKGYSDEVSAAKDEVSELKREIFRLQQGKK